MQSPKAPVLYIPHGGGPLPLLGDASHRAMNGFLKSLAATFPKPDGIVLISAHWQETSVRVTAAAQPQLIYDYYGFPEQAYQLKYPACGNPALAQQIGQLLTKHNIDNQLDLHRGFDHGLYVPLTLMYPEANIPCVQLSLNSNLDPQQHIATGKALAALREQNILIIGSGFSFHNMREFSSSSEPDIKNLEFEKWLSGTCQQVDPRNTENALIHWQQAPFARYCHPTEEHLLPLMVCFGAAYCQAKQIFDDVVIGKKVSGFRWN